MVLVTGATGLVGSHLLLELLRNGKQVRALKRAGSSTSTVDRIFAHYNFPAPDKSIWVEGDVTDYFSLLDAMDGVEHVYHCAAMVSFAASAEATLMKVNAEGTANVVNAAMEKGVKKVCHVSSTAALGRADNDKIISEETVWKISDKNSAYAVSKYAAEREVWRATEEGLDAVIVNPCIIIGPGDVSKSSGRMIQSVKKGLKFYTGGANAFIDVRDVAKLMIALTESGIKNQRFILAAENLDYKKVFELIAAALKKPAPTVRATAFMSALAWRVAWLAGLFSKASPFITRETAMTGQQRNVYSNKKVKEKLNWEFIPVKEAIENACKFL
jgi:nucleoside-diphosphate-sugar epimerase